MKEYAVIGLGRFGASVAENLAQLGHQVVVIDKSEDLVNQIAKDVTYAVSGDATDVGVLKSIGIGNVDVAVIAISSNFESSIMATILCKELGVGKVIAKAKNETHSTILKRVGADSVVVPERDMGKKVAHNLSSKNVVELYSLSADFELLEIIAPRVWSGKSIAELDIRAKYGLNIMGIIKENEEFIGNPGPNTIIGSRDTLVVIGETSAFARLEALEND